MREFSCDEVRDMAGAYVLGALDAAAEAALRTHLETCSQAHEEIAELGAVIPALIEAVPVVEPSEGLKARIMAAAVADLAARGGAAGIAGTSVGAVTVPATAAAPALWSSTPGSPIAFPGAEQRAAGRTRTSTGGWLLRIAAVLAIAALGGWNVLLQGQLSTAQRYEQSVADVLNTASQPGSLTAILTADGGTGSGLAAVDANGEMALAMRDLAPTSGESVYAAWMIGSDGVPVSLGDFRVDGSGTAFFESAGLPTTDGIVLALTREPGPGARTPTTPVISKGVTVSAG